MPGFQDTTALQTLFIVAISGILTLVLGTIALLFPNAGDLRRIESALSRFAERKTLAILTLFFSVITGNKERANSDVLSHL
jgi:hypothetical protein